MYRVILIYNYDTKLFPKCKEIFREFLCVARVWVEWNKGDYKL